MGEHVASLAHSAFPRSAHACAALGAREPGEVLDPPQAKTADAKTVTAILRFIDGSPSALDPLTKIPSQHIALGRGRSRFGVGRKPTSHDIFDDHAGKEKTLEIAFAAGLCSGTAQFETAERVALDDRAGDAAVQIQVADDQLALGARECDRAS